MLKKSIIFTLNKLGYNLIKLKNDTSIEFRRFSNDKFVKKEIYRYLAENFTNKILSPTNLLIDKENLIELFEEYDEIFRKFKYKNILGGLGYNNGLFLFICIKASKPKLVVESGVYKGFTTYIIENAINNNTNLICFEPNLDKIKYKSKKAKYFKEDITKTNFDYEKETLVFFDDHIPHLNRLKYAMEKKIKYLIFDDDVSITNFFHDGMPPIPSLSMIKQNINNYSLNWTYDGNEYMQQIKITNEEKNIINNYIYVKFFDCFEFTGYRNSSFTSFLKLK